MKKFATLVTLFSLGLFAVGCSQEQQLENAQEDFVEEQGETNEAVADAQDDGIVTTDEAETIQEEQGEDAEAAGDVADEAGELIQEETNN